MDRRFSRESSRESKEAISLQKKIVETRKPSKQEHVPDLTDFMNDMFFGTVSTDKKAYNLMGDGSMEESEDFDDSPRRNSSKLTQEWLEEAKRMVASSPSRCDSPSRLVGSPRFAAAQNHRSAALLDRRDPLSRSARRHRSVEGFSGEIISKSATHSRNNSVNLDTTTTTSAATNSPDQSPASVVHKWFSNILKPPNPTPPPPPSSPHQENNHRPVITTPDSPAQNLPPRLSVHRRSRFQNDPSATQPQQIPTISRRTFKTPAPLPNTQLLSPPKNLVESAHRRSISSSTCSLQENLVLSPPRKLVESAHRRSISSATCSIEKIATKQEENGRVKEGEVGRDLNGFLKEQKVKIGKILKGEVNGKAKIVLSGPTNSTTSMVAAICYAWLLENRIRNGKEGADGEWSVVVPVMNVRRGRMWKQRQAAWLFHHVGVDATALLFADEVDLETLMMARQLSMLVVGQDILRIDGEVGSQCTILTDNYCEDAYDLLQTTVVKKLLLAGILLDTKNLNASAKLSMTRDAEAVQLLLVGSAPNYRNALFDQLMQDQREGSFLEALRHNYGKPPTESGRDIGAMAEHKVSERKSTSVYHEDVAQNPDKNSNDLRSAKTNAASPKSAKPKSLPAKAPAAAPAQAAPDASRGKNKFFLAKWFGFGK
ncbi:hypothetical protein L1049_027633 [Liquidambar formosana]|uniref:Uncharacterized protein n=1 Tax=Liquidambar formosana TaxID=63359 RepID=A0AAP0RJH6_LIQFO